VKSRLQHSEIPLRDFQSGWVIVEPGGEPRRSVVQLQTNDVNARLALTRLSPEEAYAVGLSLIEHAKECGYDEDTGETTLPED